MIAADTSTLSALLSGEEGEDVERLADAMRQSALKLPPVVVTEILTDARVAKTLESKLANIDLLEVSEGYWRRAGENRAKIKARGLKANVADALIAQSCLDHDAVLITRDPDFRHFVKFCGLRLA